MRIKVRVTAGARREVVMEVSDHELAISVKEEAENNAANDRVRDILAERLQVRRSAIRFISGMRGRTKIFEVVE